MNNIDKRALKNLQDVYKSGNPYVYLVDNKQKMMLILKRDLEEIGVNNIIDESSYIRDFINEKVHGPLHRTNSGCPLSHREIEVLDYAATGKSNKQIAAIIGLSESTIKNHLSHSLKKLHADDRTHAVILAMGNGWLNFNHSSNIPKNKETATGKANT